MKSVECESSPAESVPGYLSALDLVVSGHEKQLQRETPAPPSAAQRTATVIGRLAGFTETGVPLVEVQGHAAELPARSTVALAPAQIGSEVVLCFAAGDVGQPIIMGLLLAPSPSAPPEAQASRPTQVELNGQRLELTAQDELVLRCGKSSITLTQAGKILIRGEYLLSRSSGVNRIKGGSVQIN